MNDQYRIIIEKQEAEIAAAELKLERQLANVEKDIEECLQMLQVINASAMEEMTKKNRQTGRKDSKGFAKEKS